MKCPVCSRGLVEYSAGSFTVEICRDGCSGIWFDKAELEKCDQHHEPFPTDLLRLRKNASVVIDRNKERDCPRCSSNQVLERILLDPETRFEIDRCPRCEGNWLDIGELDRMRRISQENSDIETRIANFERKVAEQLKDADARHRVGAFLRLIMR